MVTLREIVDGLHEIYDPKWAEPWDAVGLVLGDPDASVSKVLLAVDPVQAVADEAVAMGADLVIVHHPLYLSAVTSMAATTPKGRVVHTLASNGIALLTCHTNADVPAFGVSEAMAQTLGVQNLAPLQVAESVGFDKWVIFVPEADLETVRTAMWAAGAGRIGDYDSASFSALGTGTFRPRDGANPAVGAVNEFEEVPERRLELLAARHDRAALRSVLLAAHPYEEPAYDVMELAPSVTDRGSGRIGDLAQPMSLADFGEMVAERLPQHGGATRIAGDLERHVQRVAVCGGSGDFLLGRASAAGADVYVTSDLRHHPVSEHQEHRDACAVIDVPHWAAEWTWLPVAEEQLNARWPQLATQVSQRVTDPWAATLSGTVGL